MNGLFTPGEGLRTCPSWNETAKGRHSSEWNSAQENSLVSAKCEYQIMQILAKGSATLTYLDGQIDASRSTIHRQLKALARDELVTSERRGKVDIWSLL